jgi:hypothetical protein
MQYGFQLKIKAHFVEKYLANMLTRIAKDEQKSQARKTIKITSYITAYFIFLKVPAQHISEFSNHRQQGRVSANAEGSLKDHGCQ